MHYILRGRTASNMKIFVKTRNKKLLSTFKSVKVGTVSRYSVYGHLLERTKFKEFING